MNFADFLRMRQMGPHPIGSGSGDHRMDPVEQQRGNVYPMQSAPGYVCYEDGSCIPEAEFFARQGAVPGGRAVTPQPTGRPAAMPGAGNAFAQFLLNRMAGNGRTSMAVPLPSPSMAPGSLVCDEMGNCHHQYR